MRRGLLAGIALVGVLALATGCTPLYGPAEGIGSVQLEADVRGDGSAQVRMFLDASEHDEPQLRTWGREVASRLFPDAHGVDVRIDPNDHGYPFDVVEVTGAFEPGSHPELEVDARGAVGWLLDHGARRVDLSLRPPEMPVSTRWSPDRRPERLGGWVWQDVSTRDDVPDGVLVLSPRPWQGALAVLLVLSSVGFVVGSAVAFLRRRRRLGLLLGLLAVVSPLAVAAVGGTESLNHLAASGWLPDGALPASRWAMFLPLVAALAAGVVLTVAAGSGRSVAPMREREFVVPPGWPEPPPGWRPPLGWRPDPSWPPAPDGWHFYRDAGGRV
jgi:hypothetical protein